MCFFSWNHYAHSNCGLVSSVNLNKQRCHTCIHTHERSKLRTFNTLVSIVRMHEIWTSWMNVRELRCENYRLKWRITESQIIFSHHKWITHTQRTFHTKMMITNEIYYNANWIRYYLSIQKSNEESYKYQPALSVSKLSKSSRHFSSSIRK